MKAAQRQFERDSKAARETRRKAFARAQREGLSLRDIGGLVGLDRSRVGTTVEGGVATNSNAYDDIVAAMEGDAFGEVIIETPPSHLSHWLHTDLLSRVTDLGFPVTVVPATS